MDPVTVELLIVGAIAAPGLYDLRGADRPGVRRVGWALIAVGALVAAVELNPTLRLALPVPRTALIVVLAGVFGAALWNDARQLSHALGSYFVAPLLGLALLAPSIPAKPGAILAGTAAVLAVTFPVVLALRLLLRALRRSERPKPPVRRTRGRGSVWGG